jgi:sugar (pentulose or hexulose) kinase
MSLLHGMQLFWLQAAWPEDFRKVATILPWIQYISFMLTGRAVSEISSMACQSHLVDVNTGGPSSLARRQGWDKLYAPRAHAWEVIGPLKPEYRGSTFRGRGAVLAGVHDSNANYLRYLAAGVGQFTLLSTGTWIIGFDTAADIGRLDRTRDTVTNTDILGRPVACCRFFGGKEFEVLSQGASGDLASLACLTGLVGRGIMALPSFSDSGGPIANTGGRGIITGGCAENPEERATLASLYCALMVSESLDAIQSRHAVIVDGPFAQNAVFLSVLAALRPGQRVLASDLRDGTTAGAACLALMPDGRIPHVALKLSEALPADVPGLSGYRQRWQREATRHATVR